MPKAPPSRCNHPRCPNLAIKKGRCADHQSSGWVDRRRPQDTRTTLDRLGITDYEWERLKHHVMATHRGICHWCGKPGGNQVDHIIAIALGGARTDPANLAPIHDEPCHREKTQRELTQLRKLHRGTAKQL